MRTLLLTLLLSACAPTAYQRMDSTGEGVAWQQVGPDTWLVEVAANRHTPRSTVIRYANKRAYELCRGRGFRIVDAAAGEGGARIVQTKYVTSVSSEHNLAITVRCNAPVTGGPQPR